MRLGTLDGNIADQMRASILEAIVEGEVTVNGSGGHFTIEVVSPIFEGKSMLQSQRLVLNAIKQFMAGPSAPVHAVDSLKTRVP